MFGEIKRLKKARDVEGLLAIAQDPLHSHRQDALMASFELLGEPASEPPYAPRVASVCRSLIHDSDRWVRGLAVGGLAATHALEAPQACLVALRDDDGYVRGQALLALGFLLPEGCSDEVADRLGDAEPVVRSYAARVLERLDDASAVAPLRRRLDAEDDALAADAMRAALQHLEREAGAV